MPMNPEIKSKWLAALRSGQYEQARGGLQRILGRNNETGEIKRGFCCLGVLCDLAEQADVCWWQDMEATVVDQFGRAIFNADSLPGPVMKWAGLDSVDPAIPFPVEGESLSVLNDTHQLNFHRIAALIEEHL